jgi:hypothetical protein
LLKQGHITSHKNAPADLVVVPQPKARSIEEFPDYVFGEAAGEDITIYIVDSGLNADHPVSSAARLLPFVNHGKLTMQ